LHIGSPPGKFFPLPRKFCGNPYRNGWAAIYIWKGGLSNRKGGRIPLGLWITCGKAVDFLWITYPQVIHIE